MKKLLTVALTLLLSACSSMPDTPDGFRERDVQTEHFSIPVWESVELRQGKTIRFYIEGNGNPTPDTPMALKLAAKDPYINVVVLSRPCQYSKNQLCNNPEIWTRQQYSPEILREMEEIVVYYIQKYKAPDVEFVAYDGGAPVAFNLALQLGRVNKITTIAGILDIDAYATQNGLPAFVNAKNPMDSVTQLSQIPQIHFVGGKDRQTTPAMAERFVSKLPNPRMALVRVAPDMGHDGWDKIDLDY